MFNTFKVKLINEDNKIVDAKYFKHLSEYDLGSFGVGIGFDEDDIFIQYSNNDRYSRYMYDEEVEIIKKEDMMDNLKVGTKVRVLNDRGGHSFTIGSIVEVYAIRHGGVHRFIDTKIYDTWFMPSNAYEILKDTEIQYRVIGGHDSHHYFEIGTIVTWVEDNVYKDRYGLHQCLIRNQIEPILVSGYSSVDETTCFNLDDGTFKINNECESLDIEVEQGTMSTFIMIGNFTIAIPKDIPMGITSKHPDDIYSKEVGQAISQIRMFDDAYEKGIL